MIVRSGVAETLIKAGKTWAFVSNVDNPGADLDPTIAYYLQKQKIDFCLEFAERTPNDRSGGVLVTDTEPCLSASQGGGPGSRLVLELSQVPDAHLPQFGSLAYSAFNTNNMWIYLPRLVELVQNGVLRKLHPQTVIRDLNGVDYLQLETTVACALPHMPSALCLGVPRARWRVVKTTADLMMVRSKGLLRLHKGRLVIGEERRIPGLPSIKWGAQFRNVRDMETRIPFPPDLLELQHLSVEGDVRFGRNVKLAGTVIIIASGMGRLIIPDNAVLRDNIVIGELTLTPH